MEGCKKMHCGSSTSKLMSKFLLMCSIFNVMALPICVCGLDHFGFGVFVPIHWFGFLFCNSVWHCLFYDIYSFCEKDETNDDFEHTLILPSDSTVTCYDIKIEANVLLFKGIAILLSLINNIVVTVLWSKNICKCNCNSNNSSIPIAGSTVRHPPANPQQFAPNWAIPLTGKQHSTISILLNSAGLSQQQPMN
uniref:Transmembrane protein n=1 Tax=Daphnia galeata TaxID=27404 RepID=A0A8J2RQ76_9CRUS|nr:unnamed protein product [Daphnia galeata]